MITKEQIDDIVLRVYRARLDADSGEGAADRQRNNDAKDGEKFPDSKQLSRAQFYRATVVETLVQAGVYERAAHWKAKAAKESENV